MAKKKYTKLNRTVNSYHSAKDFVQSAQGLYGLSRGQAEGFISFMKSHGMYMMLSEQDFVPYLRLYLGLDD